MESGVGLEGFRLDALREVANIGAGHAATALSQMMTHRRVMINVPDIKMVQADALPEIFGNPDAVIVAVSMLVLGDLPGRTVLAMPEQTAHLLCDLVLERAPGTTTTLDSLEHSTIAEAGNILGSAYLNALAAFLDMMMLPSVPTLVIDKPDDLVAQLDISPEQTVFCASTTFTFPDDDPEQTLDGQFLHLPEPSSLEVLFQAIAE